MSDAYRQGDVYLERVDALPTDAERITGDVRDGRLILVWGEATGHHHSVAVADAELFTAAEAVYLRVMTATPLEHQEHDAITLTPGLYRRRPQVEYRPADLPQTVAD